MEFCTEIMWAEKGKGLQEAGVSSLDPGETVEKLGCSGWKYHRRRSEFLEMDGGSSHWALRVLEQSKGLGLPGPSLVAMGITPHCSMEGQQGREHRAVSGGRVLLSGAGREAKGRSGLE